MAGDTAKFRPPEDLRAAFGVAAGTNIRREFPGREVLAIESGGLFEDACQTFVAAAGGVHQTQAPFSGGFGRRMQRERFRQRSSATLPLEECGNNFLVQNSGRERSSFGEIKSAKHCNRRVL